MEPTEKIKLHRGSDYHACTGPIKYAIIVEPTGNHIQCEAKGMFWGYSDLVKLDEIVWTNQCEMNLAACTWYQKTCRN